MEKNRDYKLKRIFWSFLLFVDVLLFIESIVTQTVWVMIVVMIVSEFINFKGNEYLFGEFDIRRKKKREIRRQEYLKQRALNSNK